MSAIAAIDRRQIPLGAVSISSRPVAFIKLSTGPLASLAVPILPPTVEEAGLMGMDGFLLGADGTVLQGADL